MPNESIESCCSNCGGEVKCEYRSKLKSEWYCICCGTLFGRQPRMFVDDKDVSQAMEETVKELISHGIIKPEMRLVSKIVMKRLGLGTMSYVVGDTIKQVFPK